MTAYHITAATSRFVNGGNAFADRSSGPDSLVVDDGAYLVALGNPYDAVDLDEHGAWTVTINGSLFADTSNGFGIYLFGGNAAASTITIGASGQIAGGTTAIVANSAVTIANAGFIANTIRLGGHTADILSNSATGTIGTHGLTTTAIDATGTASLRLGNAGTIYGSVSLGSGNDVVINSGGIGGYLYLGEGNNTYTGTSASFVLYGITAGAGNDSVLTSGETVFVQLGDGTNSLTIGATGSLLDGITGGSGSDSIVNYGSISGSVFLNGGMDSFHNYGTVAGNLRSYGRIVFANAGTFNGDFYASNEDDVFANTKIFHGDVYLGGSFPNGDVLTNTGLLDGYIFMAEGNATITNSGTIGGGISWIDQGRGVSTLKLVNSGTIDGNIVGHSAADTIVSTGRISGYVDLGAGNDTFTGGAYADKVGDGFGSDKVYLGGGNDDYYAWSGDVSQDGVDIVDGGAGIDTFRVQRLTATQNVETIATATSTIVINIDIIDHTESVFNSPKNLAVGPSGMDHVYNFENVSGTLVSDIIFGSAVANDLNGSGGADSIYAYGGNDTINGGDGVDTLDGGIGNDTINGGLDDDFIIGGAGADLLTGGNGVDIFIYRSVTDSGPLKAAHDTITDFVHGTDHIELSQIDADQTKATSDVNNSFHWVGTNTPFAVNNPGGLRVVETPAGWTVEGEVNGDGKADIAIDIADPTHQITITASDFYL